MKPCIENLTQKKLIGQRLIMLFAENKTPEIWHRFMPRRKEIKNALNPELISMQVYSQKLDIENISPDTSFEKWAAVEVANFDTVPAGLEIFILSSGLYAVFIHQGSSTDNSTFQYIFGTWLPNSEYVLDVRPHFEILGEKYKNNDPNSEEEIWITIKPRK